MNKKEIQQICEKVLEDFLKTDEFLNIIGESAEEAMKESIKESSEKKHSPGWSAIFRSIEEEVCKLYALIITTPKVQSYSIEYMEEKVGKILNHFPNVLHPNAERKAVEIIKNKMPNHKPWEECNENL